MPLSASSSPVQASTLQASPAPSPPIEEAIALLDDCEELFLETESTTQSVIDLLTANVDRIVGLDLCHFESILYNPGLVNTIAHCKNLTMLRLGHDWDPRPALLKDHDLITLVTELTQLRIFSLIGCTSITDVSISQIELSNVESLKIISCPNISGSGIASLVSKMPNLDEIHLDYCDHLTDFNLNEIMRACEKPISSLSIERCDMITGLGIDEMLEYQNSFETLNLSSLPHVTTEKIMNIADKCTDLSSINLSYLDSVTDAVVNKFLNSPCKNLALRHCQNISLECLPSILQKGSNLESLNIADTVLAESSERIQEKHPECRVLTETSLNSLFSNIRMTARGMIGQEEASEDEPDEKRQKLS